MGFNSAFKGLRTPLNHFTAENSIVVIYRRHISVMESGHLLTRSGLTYPEVSSKVCLDSFCQLGNSVSLSWVIYYGAFYLHVVSSFSFIPVICPKLVLFIIPLQFVYFFVRNRIFICYIEALHISKC